MCVCVCVCRHHRHRSMCFLWFITMGSTTWHSISSCRTRLSSIAGDLINLLSLLMVAIWLDDRSVSSVQFDMKHCPVQHRSHHVIRLPKPKIPHLANSTEILWKIYVMWMKPIRSSHMPRDRNHFLQIWNVMHNPIVRSSIDFSQASAMTHFSLLKTYKKKTGSSSRWDEMSWWTNAEILKHTHIFGARTHKQHTPHRPPVRHLKQQRRI